MKLPFPDPLAGQLGEQLQLTLVELIGLALKRAAPGAAP
jgi:hypothetical protein